MFHHYFKLSDIFFLVCDNLNINRDDKEHIIVREKAKTAIVSKTNVKNSNNTDLTK